MAAAKERRRQEKRRQRREGKGSRGSGSSAASIASDVSDSEAGGAPSYGATAPDPWQRPQPNGSSSHPSSSSSSSAATPSVLPTAPLPAASIIHDVILFGLPTPTSPDRWAAVRRVPSGRVVNGYSGSDFVLKFVYRFSSLHAGIAGLGPVTGGSGEAVAAASSASGRTVVTSANDGGSQRSRATSAAEADAASSPPSSSSASPSTPAAASSIAPVTRVTWWRGVESVDCGGLIKGHLEYGLKMEQLLELVGLER